jgi:hypothetical protein
MGYMAKNLKKDFGASPAQKIKIETKKRITTEIINKIFFIFI